MAAIEFLGPAEVDRFDGSWRRGVLVNGRRYRLGVFRASGPRRIAYSSKIGYKWEGVVYDAAAAVVWSGEVPKSLGARGLLKRAGLLPAVA